VQALNFPAFEPDIREQGQKKFIYDIVRKKLIPLTPEEWVRQHALHYLVNHFSIAAQTIAVEREITYNQLKKRFDILIFQASGKPKCIVECKAPSVKITTETVLQIGMYNTALQCPWLWITNGLDHFWFSFETGQLKPASEPEKL
jgi:type I site-specific restriction endonuclease